jgi:hypothetical protein
LLVITSAIAVRLEPSHRDLWLPAPLTIAAALLCTAALLALHSTPLAAIAAAIHVVLFGTFVLGALLSVFLLITILFFGTGLVLFLPCIALAGNSVFTFSRIFVSQRRLPAHA